MTNKLAVIGASYLQLPLVLKAKSLGLEVHCFAWEKDAICKPYADFFYPTSVIEKELILEICERVSISAVLSIASDIAVLTVNYIADKLGLIGNPDLFSNIATNKYLMRKCFLSNSIPSPNFKLITKSTRTDDLNLKYPLIVKPTDRSGSRGVTKVNHKSEFEAAAFRACNESFSSESIAEEFVNGREISVETISCHGEHFILAITDKVTTGEPFFVELEHHQPTTLPIPLQDSVRQVVVRALDSLHIRFGASHSELKITDSNDIFVIEIGARMAGDFIGSDLVYLSTGYDFLKGAIDVSLGQFEAPVISVSHHAGVYFLCLEAAHIEHYITNYKRYPDIIRAEITDKTLHPIKCSADRSGYFIYSSNNKFTI